MSLKKETSTLGILGNMQMFDFPKHFFDSFTKK